MEEQMIKLIATIIQMGINTFILVGIILIVQLAIYQGIGVNPIMSLYKLLKKILDM